MTVLIIGWSIYDKLPKDEQKEFELVERYRTDYFYECLEKVCGVIDFTQIDLLESI